MIKTKLLSMAYKALCDPPYLSIQPSTPTSFLLVLTACYADSFSTLDCAFLLLRGICATSSPSCSPSSLWNYFAFSVHLLNF